VAYVEDFFEPHQLLLLMKIERAANIAAISPVAFRSGINNPAALLDFDEGDWGAVSALLLMNAYQPAPDCKAYQFKHNPGKADDTNREQMSMTGWSSTSRVKSSTYRVISRLTNAVLRTFKVIVKGIYQSAFVVASLARTVCRITKLGAHCALYLIVIMCLSCCLPNIVYDNVRAGKVMLFINCVRVWFCNYGRILICETFPYIVTHAKQHTTAETLASSPVTELKSTIRTHGEQAVLGVLTKAFETSFCALRQETTVSGTTVNVKYQSWAVAMGSGEWDAYFTRLGGAWRNIIGYPKFVDQLGAFRELILMVFGARLY